MYKRQIENELFHLLSLDHKFAAIVAHHIHLISLKRETSVFNIIGLPIPHHTDALKLLHLLVGKLVGVDRLLFRLLWEIDFLFAFSQSDSNATARLWLIN